MLKHTLTQNALYRVDIIYSIIWMKTTGKDKYAYRDESKIHALIMKWMRSEEHTSELQSH